MSSNKKAARQILGMNNSKLDVDVQRLDFNNKYNEQNDNLGGANHKHNDHNDFLNYFNLTTDLTRNYSKIYLKNQEDKYTENLSKNAVPMPTQNFNQIVSEEMAAYWHYGQPLQQFGLSPTYGMITPAGPAALPYQLQFIPVNPTILSRTFHNRNQTNLDAIESNSSNVINPHILSTQNLRLNTPSRSLNCLENNGNNAANIILNQKLLLELTHLIMHASETAERIAYTHRNRPCFKKIDSLCARLKQDLIRPDGVLPNINSQGIEWAVKDFIFAFTRIANAWIIIKGYAYNTPEGLNKIKASLGEDFLKKFTDWQNTTKTFIEILMKSFINLNQLVQNYKPPQKNENVSKSNSSTPTKNANKNTKCELNDNYDDLLDFLNISPVNGLVTEGETESDATKPLDENKVPSKSYYSTLVQDSEENQRKTNINGTYFKTGIYNPIWKEPANEIDLEYCNGKKDCVSSIFENLQIAPILDTIKHENSFCSNQENASCSSFSSTNNTQKAKNNKDCDNNYNTDNKITYPMNKYINPNCNPESLNCSNSVPIKEDGKCFDFTRNIFNGESPKNHFSYDLKVLVDNVSKYSNSFDPTICKPIGQDNIKKMEILLKKIQNLPEGDLFFDEKFTKNYFPDFISKCQEFIDLRTIFSKAQIGGYAHINEFVQDLKLISQVVNLYLKNTKDDFLEMAINKYDSAINKILKDEIFNEFNFVF